MDFYGTAQSTTFPYYTHPLTAGDPIGMHRGTETISYFIVIQSPALMVKMMGGWSGFGGYAYVGLVK